MLIPLQKAKTVTEQINNQIIDQNRAAIAEANRLSTQINAERQNLQHLRDQAKEAADIFYQQAMETAETNFERSMEQLSQKYELAAQEYEKEYQQTLKESTENIRLELSERTQKVIELDKHIAQLKSTEAAAVESAKRAEEIRQKTDFYRVLIPEVDLQEIARLRELAPYLRDKEPINKVIWKVYYEKPTSDMIGRVIGKDKPSGIYKITNITNGMCYVGQSTSVSDRWVQHIKRALGAETPTRNKLYPAMTEHGVENFTFELVERCPKDKLDEREDYWQDYFQATTWGYSIK